MTRHNKRLGQSGEQVAAAHLFNSGYTILETNYTTRFAEIDIIAITKDCLVFVEVKARTSIKKDSPKKRCTPASSTKSFRRPGSS